MYLGLVYGFFRGGLFRNYLELIYIKLILISFIIYLMFFRFYLRDLFRIYNNILLLRKKKCFLLCRGLVK